MVIWQFYTVKMNKYMFLLAFLLIQTHTPAFCISIFLIGHNVIGPLGYSNHCLPIPR